MAYILASGSPRRKEILTELGYSFTVKTSDVDETIPDGITPRDGVRILAERKALAISDRAERGDTVIAADTLVELNGVPLGKPRDRAEARAMLRALSASSHKVHTGVALLRDGKLFSDTETTAVLFRALSDEEIEAYIDTGEPFDKAGAYGIQGGASRFVDHIEGALDCVIGFPSKLFLALLREAEG